MKKKHLIKSNTLWWWKTLRELKLEGNFLNMIKGICEKSSANILLSGKRLKASPFDQQEDTHFHPC